MRMGFVNMRFAIACLWLLGVAAVRGEDLTTLTGLTFSNIEVREVKWDSLLIKHDTGISKVFLAEIPADLRAHYKQMAPPPEPRAAPAAPATQEPVGSNDLATLSGMQYRNVAVRRVEKDAVLISHDHSDHTRCLGVYQRKFGLPVYATRQTLRAAAGWNRLGRVEDVVFFDGRNAHEEPGHG